MSDQREQEIREWAERLMMEDESDSTVNYLLSLLDRERKMRRDSMKSEVRLAQEIDQERERVAALLEELGLVAIWGDRRQRERARAAIAKAKDQT